MQPDGPSPTTHYEWGEKPLSWPEDDWGRVRAALDNYADYAHGLRDPDPPGRDQMNMPRIDTTGA